MSATEYTYVTEPGNWRLDKLLADQLPDLSRNQVQRLIADGHVTVDGVRPAKSGVKLQGGELLVVRVPPVVETDLVAEPIPLNIVYEDDDLLVIDKPAGMVVHPAAGHSAGTLVNAVLAHVPDIDGIGGERRPGIVHRLDKDTSGLIVVAKNDRAYRFLQAQFKNRTVQKQYHALVVGRLPSETGIIDAPIGRDPRNRKRMTVTTADKGRAAQTEYRVVATHGRLTELHAWPKTGRTHQIRVHFHFMGTPLAGDRLYGTRESLGQPVAGLTRHFLHASHLRLQLPSGLEKHFQAPLPADLQAVLANIQ